MWLLGTPGGLLDGLAGRPGLVMSLGGLPTREAGQMDGRAAAFAEASRNMRTVSVPFAASSRSNFQPNGHRPDVPRYSHDRGECSARSDGHSSGPGLAGCEAVGSAYVGSNHQRKWPVSWVFPGLADRRALCRRGSSSVSRRRRTTLVTDI